MNYFLHLQNSPTITKYPAKSGFDSTEDRIEETHPSDECNSLDNESIDENDFAENYQDINSEIESAKMELDCSPIKPLKKQENMHKKPAMGKYYFSEYYSLLKQQGYNQ